MLAKQNNIIMPARGGVFGTKIFSCCFYGFYWIIRTCCVNPYILNGLSSLGLSSVAICFACTSVKSMNFYGSERKPRSGTKKHLGKYRQQSKFSVSQTAALCLYSLIRIIHAGRKGLRFWHPLSSVTQVLQLTQVLGLGGKAALSKARVLHHSNNADLHHSETACCLGRYLLSFPSAQAARIFISSGGEGQDLYSGLFPERSWPSAASFDFSRKWGSWAFPISFWKASSGKCLLFSKPYLQN